MTLRSSVMGFPLRAILGFNLLTFIHKVVLIVAKEKGPGREGRGGKRREGKESEGIRGEGQVRKGGG